MTESEARARLRALDADLDLRVRRISPTEWRVPSLAVDGASYLVSWYAGQYHCSCPAYVLAGRECKHVAAVALLLERETTPRAARPRVTLT